MLEKHPFKPFIPENCEILILGSFPGKESTQNNRENDWYYGANRNQFWKILELVYNTELVDIQQKQSLFKKAKIGISDIISACERIGDSNSDKNLKNKIYNKEIKNILTQHSIRNVLFTSKNVFKEFTENYEKPQNVDLIILPSPSPVYRRLNLEGKSLEYKKYLPSL